MCDLYIVYSVFIYFLIIKWYQKNTIYIEGSRGAFNIFNYN